MFCSKCGMQLSNEWKICPGCGRGLEGKETVESMEPIEPTEPMGPIEPIEERTIEISAGELTVSGQLKFTTEILIKGNQLTIKNYLNTKQYSEPVVNTFLTNNIEGIKYRTCMVFRRIHKIRFIGAAILFVLSVVGGELYFMVISALLAALTCFFASQRAMEIRLKDNRKIRIYYNDKDEIVQVEQIIGQIS